MTGIAWTHVYPTGILTDGGYAEYCTLDATALAHIPEEADVAKAAPLLCAGVTVFNGMRNMGSKSLGGNHGWLHAENVSVNSSARKHCRCQR